MVHTSRCVLEYASQVGDSRSADLQILQQNLQVCLWVQRSSAGSRECSSGSWYQNNLIYATPQPKSPFLLALQNKNGGHSVDPHSTSLAQADVEL